MTKIEYLRLEAGMSRLTLSKMLDVSPLYLRQLELSKASLTEKLIYDLCVIFNISADYLLETPHAKLCSEIQRFSKDEIELLEHYRKCSFEARRYLRDKTYILSMEQTCSDYTLPKYLDSEKKSYHFPILKNRILFNFLIFV